MILSEKSTVFSEENVYYVNYVEIVDYVKYLSRCCVAYYKCFMGLCNMV